MNNYHNNISIYKIYNIYNIEICNSATGFIISRWFVAEVIYLENIYWILSNIENILQI